MLNPSFRMLLLLHLAFEVLLCMSFWPYIYSLVQINEHVLEYITPKAILRGTE